MTLSGGKVPTSSLTLSIFIRNKKMYREDSQKKEGKIFSIVINGNIFSDEKNSPKVPKRCKIHHFLFLDKTLSKGRGNRVT